MDYRGLTWDHPRGSTALRAAAEAFSDSSRGDTLVWDAQPLEGFESAPIAQLCAEYDFVVMDHPHLGDARAASCLQSVESAFGIQGDAVIDASYIGASLASYRVNGATWALPLDAAAPVAAADPSRVARLPDCWDDVDALAADVPVALSIAGPHALLTLYSMLDAVGAPVAADGSIHRDAAANQIERMQRLVSWGDTAWASLNPIALLERISRRTDIAYCPLVYGYVNYSSRPASSRVEFGEAPKMRPDGRRGSILGGTGLSISQRASLSPAMQSHLLSLVSPELQVSHIPEHEGQPAHIEAWRSSEVDRAAHGFYSSTTETVAGACLRPRFAGYPAFQSRMSLVIREAVLQRTSIDQALLTYDEALPAL